KRGERPGAVSLPCPPRRGPAGQPSPLRLGPEAAPSQRLGGGFGHGRIQRLAAGFGCAFCRLGPFTGVLPEPSPGLGSAPAHLGPSGRLHWGQGPVSGLSKGPGPAAFAIPLELLLPKRSPFAGPDLEPGPGLFPGATAALLACAAHGAPAAL